MVQVIEVRRQFCRFLQADLVLARRAGHPFDALQHGVQDRPCEVGFRVRQARWIVRACRLGQGQEPFAFQVFYEDTLLPRRPVLNEEPGQHLGKGNVFSRQRLTFF